MISSSRDFLTACLSLGLSACASAQSTKLEITPPDGIYIVVGRAVHATKVTSPGGDPTVVRLNDDYVVRVRVTEVVDGPSQDFLDEIVLTLVLHDDFQLMHSDIVAIVDIKQGKDKKLLHWGFVSRIACIPSALEVKNGYGFYFNSPFKDGSGKRCALLESTLVR